VAGDVWVSDDPLAGQPFLGESQLRTLRRYGSEQAMAAGDVLFADGDCTYDLIVVLEGCVDVVEQYGRPDSDVIVTYGRLEFVGEMGLLTGQRVFLTGVAAAPGRVLRIPVEQVRAIMAGEPDLSELILRSFLFRRALLTIRGAGLTLVGSRLCAGTRRLLEVLARNRLSSRWLELERSSEAEALLQTLQVGVSDLPIVLVPGHRLLRNPSNRELLGALGLATWVEGRYDEASVCDLLVVGGGPGGLAAAVYGASEGLRTTLAEDTALGGQAEPSSHTEVVRLIGDDTLSGVQVRHNAAGTSSVLRAGGLFVFIGAKPATDWFEGQLAVDQHGFVLTGPDLPRDIQDARAQPPLLLETSRPGIFCIGDVRSGSIKRTATAIGEGSMAVRLVFDRLQTTGLAVAAPPTVDAAS
jgi:CRP-like cAMP-binding protein